MNSSQYDDSKHGQKVLKNDNQIEEKKPEFRSVQITAHQTGAFQMMRQPKYSSALKNHTSSTEAKKARWVVITAKPMPNWSLARGVLLTDEDATLVSSRIDESLRRRSVQVRFNENQAEAVCKTKTYLEYKVSLYADLEGGTHVEVIRLRGCGMAFNVERRAIIDAAKGFGGNRDNLSASFTPKKLEIPADLMSLYKPPSLSDLENILETACDQFHSNDHNDMLFALQNLVSMTTASKIHSATAYQMSNLIMKNKSQIRDLILSIYAAVAQNTRDEVSEQICTSCLTILINGIISFTISENNSSLDKECSNFIEAIIPCLVEGVSNFKCTHNSCLALQCLLALISKSPLACNKVGELNVSPIIEQAERYGSMEHLELQKTAKSTIDILQRRTIAVI